MGAPFPAETGFDVSISASVKRHLPSSSRKSQGGHDAENQGGSSCSFSLSSHRSLLSLPLFLLLFFLLCPHPPIVKTGQILNATGKLADVWA